MATLTLTPVATKPEAELQMPPVPELPRGPVSLEETQRILDEMGRAISAEREAAQAKTISLQKTAGEKTGIDLGLSWISGQSDAEKSLADSWQIHATELDTLQKKIAKQENHLKTAPNFTTLEEVSSEIQNLATKYQTLRAELKKSGEKHEKALGEATETYKRWNDTAWGAARGTLLTVATIGGGAAVASTATGVLVGGAIIGLLTAGGLNYYEQQKKVATGESTPDQAFNDGLNNLKSDALTVAMAAPTGFAAGALRGLVTKMAASAPTGVAKIAPLMTSGLFAGGMGVVSVAPQTGVQIYNEWEKIPEASKLGTAICEINSKFRENIAAPHNKEQYLPWAVKALKERAITNPREHAEAAFELLQKGDAKVFEYAQTTLGIQTPVDRDGVNWEALADKKKWDFAASTAGNLIGLKAGARSAGISHSGRNILSRGIRHSVVNAAEIGASIATDTAMLYAGKGELTPEQQIEIIARNIVGNVTGRKIGKASQ